MNRSLSLALICAAPAALSGCGSIDRAAGVASGFVSHQLCSATFVTGADPEQFYRESIAPTLKPVAFLASHHVDRERHEVTASFAGTSARAIYRGPLGCLVLKGEPPPEIALPRSEPAPALLPEIAGRELVEPTDPVLKKALDRTFAENAAPPYRSTKAVVVVKDGRVIAERYAPGYGIESQLHGWSMTKSVTNALTGILVRQGRLSLTGPAPLAAWSDPENPRHAISVDNLLRMTSGLAIHESLVASAGSGFDDSAHMLFAERDMAGFAAHAPVKAAPGSAWDYSDGNTVLLSRVIRDLVGGDAQSVLAFAHRELFDKLGMHHLTLEFDATGTPIGSSHMYASARDWARLGLLYLDDGVIGGERILPPGWVDYSAAQTPGSARFGYGAGFWTNRGGGEGADYRVARGIPADAFFARGSTGQYVVIVPSQRLVVVRMGPAFTPRDDMDIVAQLVADVIAVTK